MLGQFYILEMSIYSYIMPIVLRTYVVYEVYDFKTNSTENIWWIAYVNFSIKIILLSTTILTSNTKFQKKKLSDCMFETNN